MEHKYEVGDLVKILPRDGFPGDYMYYFTNEMLPLVGQVCKIKHIFRNDHDGSSAKIHDDGHNYWLEGTTFTWVSSMFEPYDEKKTAFPKFKEGDLVEILPAVSSREPDKKNMASAEATPIKSDQGRPECPYLLIRESQENYNLNFNM